MVYFFKFFKLLWTGTKWIGKKVWRKIRLRIYWLRYRISESARWRHTYIVGGSGAGKSELLKSFIANHIVRGTSAIVVIDPNGDFAEQVAQFKENSNLEGRRRLVYIKPDLSDEVFPTINPFDLPPMDDRTLNKVVQEMFKTLVQSFKEMDMRLTGAMEGMLLKMLYVLYRKKGASLLDLISFVDDAQNEDLVEMGCQSNNPVVRDYFTHKFMVDGKDGTKQGLSDRVTNFLTSTTLQNLLTGKTTINLRKLINQKKLIIFDLSKGRIGDRDSRIYGRFVLTTLVNIIFSRADIPEKGRVPCHVYIDEFHNYASDSLQETFAEGRKYRIYLTVATQIVGQGLSSEMSKSILGNSNVKIIGKAGYDSRETMMKQMGFDEKFMKARGMSKRSFAKLKAGKFICQVDIYDPHKIRGGKSTLKNKNSMKLDKWIEIIEEQKRKYYAKPIPYVPPSVSNNKSTNENPFEKYAKNDGGRNRNGFEKLEATNQLKTKRGFSKIK